MLPTMFRKRVTLIAATYGMALTLIGCSNRDKEPSANGRLLSEWVVQIATTDPDSSANHVRQKVPFNKLEQIALPFLIKWISEAQPKMLAGGDVVADGMAMSAPVAFTALRGKRGHRSSTVDPSAHEWQPHCFCMRSPRFGLHRKTRATVSHCGLE